MEKELISIPDRLLKVLEKKVKKHQHDEEKPPAYSEVVGLLGLKTMTQGQATKIKSFFDNYAPSDLEQKAKHEMYGGNSMMSFVNNQLQSIRKKREISTSIRRMTNHPTGTGDNSQKGRTVDRMNSLNTTSTEPAKVNYGKSLHHNLMNGESVQNITPLLEEIERIKAIMNA